MLKTPPHQNFVRPILARIRKSLFDIIRPRIKGARFLDLYAGTGAAGLEALSEGAVHAAFVEMDPICLRTLKENVALLRYEDRATVFRGSVLGDLTYLPKPFDLIFMGPPYKDQTKTMLALTVPTILQIESHGLLADKGMVICQHHKKEAVAPPSAQWDLYRQESYGDSKLSFFKWNPS